MEDFEPRRALVSFEQDLSESGLNGSKGGRGGPVGRPLHWP